MIVNNNPNPQQQLIVTDWLTYIRAEKIKTRKEIDECTQRIRQQAGGYFKPAPEPQNKWESIMALVNRGMSVYKGVTIGIAVVQYIKQLFGRKKR